MTHANTHADLTRAEANADHADDALIALESLLGDDDAGQRRRFGNLCEDDQRAAISDLFADLFHLCDGLQLDADELIGQAQERHAEEVADEEHEAQERIGLILIKCRACGDRVDEVKPWWRPCARCRAENPEWNYED